MDNDQDTQLTIRINLGVLTMVDDLMTKFSDKYENRSHVIRCAIIKLYNEVMKNGSTTNKIQKNRN